MNINTCIIFKLNFMRHMRMNSLEKAEFYSHCLKFNQKLVKFSLNSFLESQYNWYFKLFCLLLFFKVIPKFVKILKIFKI